MQTLKTLTLAILAAVSLSANAAFKVGSMSGQEADLVHAAAKVAKEKYGLDVEVIEFDDYVQPNVALNDGEIDANAFQHKPYLNVMNKDRGFHIVPVGNTFIYPIGGYSKKYKNIKDIPDGAKIAVPNDPSNEARTLIILHNAGLIELKDPKNLEASVLDIKENPHNYEFIETEAPSLPRTLDDVDIAFINSNYAVNANPPLFPKKDAIILEPEDSPYMNIIAVRAGDENRDEVKNFVKAYHSDPVANAAEKVFKGAAVQGW